MAGDVRCWFDYSSPFAYLGTERVVPIAARHDARIEWRPFLLGGLFRAIGTPMVPIAVMPDAKARYFRRELERWAALAELPFVHNTHFPVRTVDALRVTLLAPEERRGAIVRSIMRAVWAFDRDPSDARVLEDCCRDAAVDPSLVARAHEAKQALVAATDEAIALGVPGAPTFEVSGELYWGQDRLLFVDEALEGRRLEPSNRASTTTRSFGPGRRTCG